MSFASNYLSFVKTNSRFLGFGLLMTFGSSFGQTYFIALFGAGIRNEFALTHGDYGSIYSLATLASALTLVWLGRRIDDLDLRLFSLMVTVGLAAAGLALAWAPGVVVLGLALYALRLSGQGLMTHAALTSMARYFERGRGLAISIAVLGLPLGEAILPLTAVSLVGVFGWRTTWVIIAVTVVFLVLPAAQWLLAGHGERDRRLHERTAAADSIGGTGKQWTRGDVLRDPRFYLILPAVMAPPFIVTGVFFHQVHLIESKGWTLAWFATSFIAYAASQLSASLASGPLLDRTGAQRLLPFYLIPMAVGLAALSAFDQPAVALVFMILTGATVGASSTITGALWAEIYGVAHLGAIRALLTALMVSSTALSPAALGWLLDKGTTLETIALTATIYVIAASLLAATQVRKRADTAD